MGFAIAAAALLADDRYYLRWLSERISPSEFDPPHLFMLGDVPWSRVAIWFFQSFAAWAAIIVSLIGVGVGLSMLVPWRHSATKLAGMKWSLYATGVMPVLVLGWYGYFLAFPPVVQLSMPIARSFSGPAPEVPTWVLATGYAILWGAGIAGHPYGRSRGAGAFACFSLLFLAGCSLLGAVLFRLGPLEGVL